MHGQLKFLTGKSTDPYFGPSEGGADARSTLAGEFELRDVEIRDGRTLGEAFSLDTHGFELRSLGDAGDLYDADTVADWHEPQCRALVTSATNASRVHVFDHTWRSDGADTRGRHGSREPSSFVHNDYTPRSAPKRVVDVLEEEGERLTRHDFAIINVWRPITTVYSSPVVLCDARSVAIDSLVPAERRGKGRVGEVYVVRHDPRQRWIYFSELAPPEVLLIKTFDTREDGRARWCVHTALEELDARCGKPPRESIETRLFAFFDKCCASIGDEQRHD